MERRKSILLLDVDNLTTFLQNFLDHAVKKRNKYICYKTMTHVRQGRTIKIEKCPKFTRRKMMTVCRFLTSFFRLLLLCEER